MEWLKKKKKKKKKNIRRDWEEEKDGKEKWRSK